MENHCSRGHYCYSDHWDLSVPARVASGFPSAHWTQGSAHLILLIFIRCLVFFFFSMNARNSLIRWGEDHNVTALLFHHVQSKHALNSFKKNRRSCLHGTSSGPEDHGGYNDFQFPLRPIRYELCILTLWKLDQCKHAIQIILGVQLYIYC